MAEIFWPSDIAPSSVDWKLIDPTAVFTSPLSPTIRTVSRPGLCWGVTLNYGNLHGTERTRLMALVAALRGRANRVWLSDCSSVLGGAFPAPELLTNTALAATTGWTASTGEISLYADAGRLRSTRSAVTAIATIQHASVALTSGAAYLMRAGALAGKGTMAAGLRVGSTAGNNDYLSSTFTANGYWNVSGTIAAATGNPSILDTHTARSAGGYQSFAAPSLARCIRVDGASQTGSALNVKNLPTSTNGLLLAGDLVAVYTSSWEMKRVISALNSDSSGNGYLQFEPALRSAPSDNAPIAVQSPAARFVLEPQEVSWTTSPGYFSDLSITFREDLSA